MLDQSSLDAIIAIITNIESRLDVIEKRIKKSEELISS